MDAKGMLEWQGFFLLGLINSSQEEAIHLDENHGSLFPFKETGGRRALLCNRGSLKNIWPLPPPPKKNKIIKNMSVQRSKCTYED